MFLEAMPLGQNLTGQNVSYKILQIKMSLMRNVIKMKTP